MVPPRIDSGSPFSWPAIAVTLFIVGAPAAVHAQIDFEQEPINYGQAPVDDAIVDLQQRLDTGQAVLEFDQQHGYLKSLLRHLDIGISSQVLVTSKTSLQLRKISPDRPRALYFNEASSIGWVQGGDVLEIMTTDPQQGQVFYTLAQTKTDSPRFLRDRGQCLACHSSSRTQQVPGGLVRSVLIDPQGHPQLGSSTFNTDHTSPFEQRWGGWYVTGSHGAMQHMGNVIADQSQPDRIDRETGANLTDLSRLFNVRPYLTPHSDLVALLVLEHQVQMQNLLTRANYENRSAAHYDGVMNEALKRPADYVSESTERRIAAVGDRLLQYMLFSGEFRLTAPVAGTSEFATEFVARGPHDSRGRSLRDFDLQTRLFKYPCSYLIYSPAFDQLPHPVQQYVTRRLRDVLTGKDRSPEFAHLSAADRAAIREILSETKPDLWNDRAERPEPPSHSTVER
ncbi:MAG: hypothetical protein KF861_11240 [Planctomycetaceae bacterium]|nr:hypothetical protein [Planctomycetaceae bacterium]